MDDGRRFNWVQKEHSALGMQLLERRSFFKWLKWGYLTTVEKAAIFIERKDDEPPSS